MDNRPIGVFDSGLGGLTAVRKIIEAMPGEDIIYFGDTGRVPYGNRSKETIIRYTKEDIERLNEMVRNKMLDLRAELDKRVNDSKKGGKK